MKELELKASMGSCFSQGVKCKKQRIVKLNCSAPHKG